MKKTVEWRDVPPWVSDAICGKDAGFRLVDGQSGEVVAEWAVSEPFVDLTRYARYFDGGRFVLQATVDVHFVGENPASVAGYGLRPWGRFDSDANREWQPTSASAVERRMRRQVELIARQNESLRRRVEALATVPQSVPDAEPDVDVVDREPNAEDGDASDN